MKKGQNMSNLMEKFSLSGKTALVTGGAGMLGKPFTQTLAEAGASVVVADIDINAAKLHAAGLEKDGLTATALKVDVTDPASVENMVEQTAAYFGGLDILVNSAALDPKFDPEHQTSQSRNAFEHYSLKAWRHSLEVNLTGVFLSCQGAAREMVKQGSGVIINISSIYGLKGPDQRIYPDQHGEKQYKPADYAVTKAGILGLTRYLAAYYAGTNIRVNALTPGGVYHHHEDPFLESYSAKTIIGRMASKDELTGALLFLASSASSYMTGSNLVVDGGYTAW
jgi:NAD(P)-dependent dehydrogenase (short-subunit alcohol dehydrogenase family)